jgi:hypothetical protein
MASTGATIESTKTSSSEEEEEDDDDDEDERQSNESEKADGSGTRDSSSALFFKLRKGCGLFRGTKKEKVCQICEKPGDTVKCRGPCCGTFHLECVSKALAAKENMNDTGPGSMKIKKRKTDLTVCLNEIGTSGASVTVAEGGDDSQVCELTKAEDEVSKPVNYIANLTENDVLDEKDCRSILRKSKRFSTEEQMLVSNKGDDKEKTRYKNDRGEERKKDENEKISEGKEDDGAIERQEEDCGYKESVKQETVDEERMDIDKVNDTEELENDMTGIKTKGDENKILDINEKEIYKDIRESSVVKKENHPKGSSKEVPDDVKRDVIRDESFSDGSKGERELEGCSDKENKEGKIDAEKDVVTKRGNQSICRRKGEKGGEKSDLDGNRGGMKDAVVSEENDKCRRTTRVPAKKREREDDKEMRANGKDIKKETKVNPEEKDKDERKERSVAKKKDKEEKKGKDGVTEEKMVVDTASEFRCKDCKEGRNPPCFACGRIQEEKTGREQRQRCAVGKCSKNS